MMYLEKPKDFDSAGVTVRCFVEHESTMLLLHRTEDESQGGTWGGPGGKLDPGENIFQAMVRELREETSLLVDEKDLSHYKKVYVRYPDFDFIYHMFSLVFKEKPTIKLDHSEHQNFKWVSPIEALEMDLVLDEDACIKLFYDIKE